MMGYLLDTDVCSAHLRNIGTVTSRFVQHVSELHISVVTLAELLSWTLRSKSPQKYQQGLQDLLTDVVILDFDQAVAEKCGDIRAQSFDRGQPLPVVDVMIGATALAHSLTMVTHNTQHFSRIPGLTVEDWLLP